nr:hypothetical protein CFP56_21192 [Quercus suber]
MAAVSTVSSVAGENFPKLRADLAGQVRSGQHGRNRGTRDPPARPGWFYVIPACVGHYVCTYGGRTDVTVQHRLPVPGAEPPSPQQTPTSSVGLLLLLLLLLQRGAMAKHDTHIDQTLSPLFPNSHPVDVRTNGLAVNQPASGFGGDADGNRTAHPSEGNRRLPA